MKKLIILILSITLITLNSIINIKEPETSIQLNYTLKSVIFHIEKTIKIKPKEDKPIKTQLLGNFRVTFYDADIKCTGSNSGITKSGAHVTKDLTIAVDPKIIPLGSYVYIEGIGIRKAQDTGNGIIGQAIDVYVPTHNEAVIKGVIKAKVYIIKERKADN